MIASQQIAAEMSLPKVRMARKNDLRLAGALRAEGRLLLLCARNHPSDDEIDQICDLVQSSLDWEYILTKSHAHCITPLVYQNLGRTRDARIPREVLARLQTHVANNSRFNLHRTAELVGLLRVLNLNGISALPFKGPLLSLQAYGSLALREYGDLDLLVRPCDVTRTSELLLARGYHLVTSLRRTQTNRKFVPRNKDLIFENASQSVRLELHWRLTGKHFSFPLELRQLWDRLQTVNVAGMAVPTLRAEDLLLYLCSHGSRHGWERVSWICDVAELLRSCPDIDWNYISAQARPLGGERLLALGLLLISDLLGADIPPAARQLIVAEPAVENLAAEIAANLFEEHSKDISYWCRLHLRLRERRLERLRLRFHYYWRYFWLVLTPNERDHSLLAINGPFSFLYYLLRPFRLASDFGIPRVRKLARKLFRHVE